MFGGNNNSFSAPKRILGCLPDQVKTQSGALLLADPFGQLLANPYGLGLVLLVLLLLFLLIGLVIFICYRRRTGYNSV